MARQPVKTPPKQRLGDRRQAGVRAKVCAECGAAGMHRSFCGKYRTTNTTKEMAVHFGPGRLGSSAWSGFRDAQAGLLLGVVTSG